MAGLFGTTHEELQRKIDSLETKVERIENPFNTPDKYMWDEIFSLCSDIHADFKSVRFPLKVEREQAWQSFFNLRDRAFKFQKSFYYEKSKSLYNEIMCDLNNVDYDIVGDVLVGKILSFGLLKQTADDMKYKGRKLNEIGKYFSSVKHKMNKDHKVTIHQRIVEIRSNHDGFWGRYSDHKAEIAKIREEKNRIWQEKKEKSERIKESIERNIELNKSKKEKAESALERIKEKRSELQDKIWDSNHDNWKEKAEGWLDEMDEKIGDIETQIERYDKWIEEDEQKIENWQ